MRKSAFRYRTPEELALLNELRGYVNLLKNLFLPTKKANGWRPTRAGRNTRTYDDPKTPTRGHRLRRAAGPAGRPAGRPAPSDQPRSADSQHHRIQQALIASAKDKTLALRDNAS